MQGQNSNRSFLGNLAARPGQFLIPSLFVIPSLMLFIYLIFETTKLSREKIRQQFAVDSAAFIQMGDYTNLLNRTAYVNGAFPYRIFKEGYDCPPMEKVKKTDDTPDVCAYKLLYDSGAFPKLEGDAEGSPPSPLDSEKTWKIRFNDAERPGINDPVPNINDELILIKEELSLRSYIFWDPMMGIYKFYAQVYTLLGSVEESQFEVFDRLTQNFNFFRKSYYLNASTKECLDNAGVCGDDGVKGGYSGSFSGKRFQKGSSFKMHFVKKITFWAKVPQSGIPPYWHGKTNPAIDMTQTNPDGLFQLATFDPSILNDLGQRGVQVYQGWNIPGNYFNVSFEGLVKCPEVGRACVHAMVASQCPALKSANNNCVWPDPTPKYQTRLYP